MNRLVLLAIVTALAAPAVRADQPVRFNRDVRPILSDNCFLCHGPDKGRRKAKLRLDDREIALAKKAIVPGKPDESELVRRIFAADADERMPPAQVHKTLTAAQKETLKRWIAQGAEYDAHWAYIPVTRPTVPPLGTSNPIDAFLLAKLKERKVEPSPLAEPRTLLRRLSLDVIGLPPSPEELAQFLAEADAKPQAAYEVLVDRLLKSPHYGERMAAPWLDIVRFSDTVGYHGDQNQNIFPYRDYVIDSFNKNKRFDVFTTEQLAGDLLPSAGDEQLVATGFNRLNMVTREGGAQPKEYLAKYAADRVRTVSTTFLGSTMACCECHDHKFDPFSTKDFYSLAAFFADVKQWGVYQDYNYTPNPDLKNWSNDHPFPPERVVESPYLLRRQARIRQEMHELLVAAARQVEPNAIAAWRASVTAGFSPLAGDTWTAQTPVLVRATPKDTTVTPDGSILVKGPVQRGGEIRVELPVVGWVSALRLDLLPHAEHGGSIVRGGGKATTVQLTASVRTKGEAKEKRLGFYHADANQKQPRYANGYQMIGVTGGWTTSQAQVNVSQSSFWLLDPPTKLEEGDVLAVSIRSDAVGCIRLSTTPVTSAPPHWPGGPMEPDWFRVDRVRPGWPFDEEFVRNTGQPADGFAEYKRLLRDYLECRNGQSPTLVTEAWKPTVTRVLPRGDWQNETGDIVQPAVPHFLRQSANPDNRRMTRLDLAKWLTSRDNPLTARAFVNRLWKQLFGAGLSGVLDDLGAQGESPLHDELLDWLAAEFMGSGWDVKHLVRLIVTSDAYKRSATARPDLKDIDPTNRLLARQNPRRLEAEFVRDNALSVAGLINLDIGGPSAFPYQPAGYYANLNFPIRDYVASKDDRQYRRGLYMHWQRTFLHPMLANFDAPSREECWADRTVSNTPQQALTLLNDPSFVEAARVFAESLLKDAGSDAERLGRAYERALGRSIKAKERESLQAFLDEQRTYYRGNEEEATKLLRIGLRLPAAGIEPAEHAAWTSTCRVILNLHETITRY